MASVRNIIGAIATEGGVSALAWVDGKSRPIILKLLYPDTRERTFAVYDASPSKKGGAPAPFSPALPILSQFKPTDYTASRVGPILVNGKLKSQGGWFGSSGPKPDRSICLDSNGDTLLQFECADAASASSLNESFTAVSNLA